MEKIFNTVLKYGAIFVLTAFVITGVVKCVDSADAKVFGHNTAVNNDDQCFIPEEVLSMVVTPDTASKVELIKVWSDPEDIAGLKKGIIAVMAKNDPSLTVDDLDFNYIQVYKNSDNPNQVYVVIFNRPPKSELNPEGLPSCMEAYFWEDVSEYDAILAAGLPGKTSGVGHMDNIPVIHLGHIVNDPHLVNGIAKKPDIELKDYMFRYGHIITE